MQKEHKEKTIIYTDGAAKGNPGPAGWASIIVTSDNQVFEIGGFEKDSTNNRMELMGVISALVYLRKKELADTMLHGSIEIHTDSAYVVNGITSWVYSWERNGWITSTKETVLNKDLWQALLELVRFHQNNAPVVFKKIKGHAGVYGNERADVIATSFADNTPVELYSGNFENYKKLIGGELAEIDKDADAKGKSSASLKLRRTGKSSKPGYSYVSLVDGKICIDATWAECEKRVKGVKGAKYKKAMDKKEEAGIIESFKD